MGNIIKKDNNIENTQIIKEYIEYNKKNRFSNINEDLQDIDGLKGFQDIEDLEDLEDLEAIDDVNIICYNYDYVAENDVYFDGIHIEIFFKHSKLEFTMKVSNPAIICNKVSKTIENKNVSIDIICKNNIYYYDINISWIHYLVYISKINNLITSKKITIYNNNYIITKYLKNHINYIIHNINITKENNFNISIYRTRFYYYKYNYKFYIVNNYYKVRQNTKFIISNNNYYKIFINIV